MENEVKMIANNQFFSSILTAIHYLFDNFRYI